MQILERLSILFWSESNKEYACNQEDFLEYLAKVLSAELESKISDAMKMKMKA